MSACEECWNRAYDIARRTGCGQAEAYRELIEANPEACPSPPVEVDEDEPDEQQLGWRTV